MPQPQIRGIENDKTTPKGNRTRDVRPLGLRIYDGLMEPSTAGWTLVGFLMAAFLFPQAGAEFLMAAIGLTTWGLTRTERVPIKIPVQSGIADVNEPNPKGQPSSGSGMFYIGNEQRTNKEVWLTNSDCRQHFLVLGTTGAGKPLSINAPVLTPAGWRRMGELELGDAVTMPDGSSAPVAGIYRKGVQRLYALSVDGGRTAYSTADHEWPVYLVAPNGRWMARPVIMTTADIAARLSQNEAMAVALTRGTLGGYTREFTPGMFEMRARILKVEDSKRDEECVCILVDHPDHQFVTQDGIVTHNTEILLGFAANALSWGSGILFCDGKGDVSLFAKMFAMARRWGREDDLLVLNFMNGGKTDTSTNGIIRTNTMNPFANGSADNLVTMVVSLMADSGSSGDMWKGRATAMFTGVMYALVYLRDKGYIDLGVQEIREHLSLKKIMSLADRNVWPDMPENIIKSVRSYLSSLAGFVEEKGENQSPQTREQHGFLEMQFTQIFTSLTDVYSNIFKTQYGEVDMFDVVLNRRILVVMLPALEKDGGELANLGKIVVAALKGMMGATLGNTLDGSWATVVDNRVTNAPSPFFVVMDEVGYYTVDGMAVMAAQGRSLGFGLVFAAQDLAAMKRNAEKESASMIANTATKIIMRTEDEETGKLAIQSGGKALKVQSGGFDRHQGELGSRYVENDGVQYDYAERIDYLDMKAQNAGVAHIIWKDKIVRTQTFYADPASTLNKKALRLRPNHFIAVPRPSIEDIHAQQKAPEIMAKLLDIGQAKRMADESAAFMKAAATATDGETELSRISRTLDKCAALRKQPINAACIAIADILHSQVSAAQTFVASVSAARSSRRDGGFQRQSPTSPTHDPSMMPDDLMPEDLEPVPVDDILADDPLATLLYRDELPAAAPSQTTLRHVEHGAAVDDGAVVAMERDIADDETVRAAFEALNFDGDDIDETPAVVEDRLQQAIGQQAGGRERADALSQAASSYERVHPSEPVFTPPATKRADAPAAATEGSAEGGGAGTELDEYLDFLLANDDAADE